MKDKLFLVKPDFMDGGQGPYYCPDSMPVEGMLGFYPHLRELVDVQYVEFQRPREVVIRELGEEHQGLPVLVISEENVSKVSHLGVQIHNGKHFLNDQKEIRGYLSLVYGVAQSHAMKNKKMTNFENCE
jgi:Protein of unknown function (DUF3088)